MLAASSSAGSSILCFYSAGMEGYIFTVTAPGGSSPDSSQTKRGRNPTQSVPDPGSISSQSYTHLHVFRPHLALLTARLPCGLLLQLILIYSGCILLIRPRSVLLMAHSPCGLLLTHILAACTHRILHCSLMRLILLFMSVTMVCLIFHAHCTSRL